MAALLTALTAALWVGSAHAQGNLYRYVNENGTKVISSSIPPKYVGQGYEILSPNGRVVQVVPPEPEPEDKERVEKERAMMAEYEVLARRYSSVDDILAARERRLAHVDTDIAILRGNISNLTSQIDELMSKAANFERAGKNIPATVFSSIDALREEVKTAEEKLRLRLEEHEKIHAEFADDVELFERGRALERKQLEQLQADSQG